MSLTPKQAATLDYIAKHPGCTSRELEDAGVLRAQSVLEGLYARNLVQRRSQGEMRTGPAPFLWSLAEARA